MNGEIITRTKNYISEYHAKNYKTKFVLQLHSTLTQIESLEIQMEVIVTSLQAQLERERDNIDGSLDDSLTDTTLRTGFDDLYMCTVRRTQHVEILETLFWCLDNKIGSE